MSNIAIKGAATGSGTFTLEAPATSTNRTLTLPDEAGTILTTATAGVSIGGPAFSAYKSGSTFVSITSGVFTKITLDTEVFDTNSNFASSTFTPTVAGYYQINAQVYIQGISVTRSLAVIYKNGSAYQNGNEYQTNANLTASRISVSSIVYCNGTTDYVELYMYANGSSLSYLPGNGLDVWLNGALVRAA